MARIRAVWLAVAGASAGAVAATANGAGPATHTAITIFTAAPDPTDKETSAFGGATYGSPIAPPTGALVTERREVDVGGSDDVRLTGVPETIDAASVQLRGLREPVAVTEQRLIPGATNVDEMLQRHVGEPITAVTAKGELTGVLRAVDAQTLVVEIAGALRVLRRDGYVLDVKLAAGGGAPQPTLVWRLAAKHPGRQAVEISYRAEGLAWSADYIAVLDPTGKTLDFTAWATVKNSTSATYDAAELTLVNTGGAGGLVTPPSPYPVQPVHAALAAPTRFAVPGLVRLGPGETVQLELMPPRVAAKVRPVVTFEAMPDPSGNFQQFQAVDCSQLSAQVAGAGRAEVALELDTPGTLPDGKVHLFERTGTRLDVLSEDQLHAAPNVARLRLAPAEDIVGERRASSCNYDERGRTIREKIELVLENRSHRAATVIAREFMWRWPMWHLEADESPKGTRAGAQAQEYRVELAAGAKQTVTYTVVYAW